MSITDPCNCDQALAAETRLNAVLAIIDASNERDEHGASDWGTDLCLIAEAASQPLDWLPDILKRAGVKS